MDVDYNIKHTIENTIKLYKSFSGNELIHILFRNVPTYPVRNPLTHLDKYYQYFSDIDLNVFDLIKHTVLSFYNTYHFVKKYNSQNINNSNIHTYAIDMLHYISNVVETLDINYDISDLMCECI